MRLRRLAGGIVRIILLFLLIVSFPSAGATGGDFNKLCRSKDSREDQRRRIALSLRIAEAKGSDSERRYFRSLLRQSNRKTIRPVFPSFR